MPKLGKEKSLTNDLPAKKVGAKKNNLYVMAEKLEKGTILQTLSKDQWCIGDSIGCGGFGEIYSASKVGTKNYDFVIKCEPHENGPLFVERNFYMRNAKLEDIEKFKKGKKLKFLGMPYMLGHGSLEINGIKQRFIVIPKYGNDLKKYVKEGGNRLLESTVYRLAIQMLNVYEFVHGTGYIHGDLKAANILLGIKTEDFGHAYLVDFGLVSSITKKEYKPDRKKMHNGTIEYTSRDAHAGVSTRRSDMEILAYNLIEWMGNVLPWVKDTNLKDPVKVQKSKEAFMENIDKTFSNFKFPSSPVISFLKYVGTLKYDDIPNYEHCRSIFEKALKELNVNNSGPLQFKKYDSNDHSTSLKSTKSNKATDKRLHKQRKSDQNNAVDSESEDDFVLGKQPIVRRTPKRIKTASVSTENTMHEKAKNSPVTRSALIAEQNMKSGEPGSATKIKRFGATLGSSPKKPKNLAGTPKRSPVLSTRPTPLKAQINFSPSFSIQSSPATPNRGKTTVNDDYVPKRNAKKKYEVNLELDVSMDTDVVINVKRKKRNDLTSLNNKQVPKDQLATKVRLNKVHNDENSIGESSTNIESPKKK